MQYLLLSFCSLALLLLSLVFQSEQPSYPTRSEVKNAVVSKHKSDTSKVPLHLQLAIQLDWMKEQPASSNRGKGIDDLQILFGFINAPWCAMLASKGNRDGSVVSPIVWSARAKDFIVKGCSWKLSDIIYKRYIPKPGDYRVKTRRGGNHVDIFISWDTLKQEGLIIGGNVGDKVSIRKVSLKTMITDGTTHITEVIGFYPIKKKIIRDTIVIVRTEQIHATWYGGKFHGRKTASGEKFDTNKLTAAHKRLPLGTKVIVENPKNGKRVMVRINDRCPKSGVIDLSKSAADSIGIRSQKVLIHILR
jgi:rare lipoprotein A